MTNQRLYSETSFNDSIISSNIPEINYQYQDRLILPKGPIPTETSSGAKNTFQLKGKKRLKKKCLKNNIVTPLKNFIKCVCQVSQISKLSTIFSYDTNNLNEIFDKFESQGYCIGQQIPDKFSGTRTKLFLMPLGKSTNISSSVTNNSTIIMLPSMPQLGTPIRTFISENDSDSPNNQDVHNTFEQLEHKDIQDFSHNVDNTTGLQAQNSQFLKVEAATGTDQECMNEKVSIL